MPRLPDATALGERPEPRPTGAVASYDATAPGRVDMQMGESMTEMGMVLMRGEQMARSKAEAVERVRYKLYIP